ncbi:MAG: guanylate kinase [Chloroflexota bacterium]
MAGELPHIAIADKVLADERAGEVAVLSEKSKPGLLFVLSGPSGVGKDAVMDKLREQRFPLRFAVTATTRRQRRGEVHGVDYCFVSDAEFDRMIAQDELLEWALVHGNRYGVPREPVRRAIQAGEDVLMRVDVQGAATIRAKVPGVVLIFLAPPSMSSLIGRLSKRGTETSEELAIRIANAVEEMKHLPEFDYKVTNPDDGLEEAVWKVKAIITAEKCRVYRRQVTV